jgi:hypothetical protein
MARNPSRTTPENPPQDKFRSFLVKLATEDSKLRQFLTEPHATMNGEGLSPEDQAILMSGDANRIHGRLRGKPAESTTPPVLLVDLDSEGEPVLRRGGGGTTQHVPPMWTEREPEFHAFAMPQSSYPNWHSQPPEQSWSPPPPSRFPHPNWYQWRTPNHPFGW